MLTVPNLHRRAFLGLTQEILALERRGLNGRHV